MPQRWLRNIAPCEYKSTRFLKHLSLLVSTVSTGLGAWVSKTVAQENTVSETKKSLSYRYNWKEKSAGFLVCFRVRCQEISLRHLPTLRTGDKLSGTFRQHISRTQNPIYPVGRDCLKCHLKIAKWHCLATVLCYRMGGSQLLQIRTCTSLGIFHRFSLLTPVLSLGLVFAYEAINKPERCSASMW